MYSQHGVYIVNDNNYCNFITDLKVIQSSNALTLRNTYFITHTIGRTNMADMLESLQRRVAARQQSLPIRI